MIQNSTAEKISVVVPVYNEEENVGLLIDRIQNSLKENDFEILLVDDGSTGRTRQVVKEINNPNVGLSELKKNYGQGRALAAGVEFATGDYIVTMDGELQDDADDIMMMLNKAQSDDWAAVTGIRQNRQDHLVRTFPSKIANWIIRKTTKLNIQDHGCALKVFNRDTAKD